MISARGCSRAALRITLLGAWAILAVAPLPAQEAGGSADALAERMHAFLQEVPRSPNTGLAEYFPRRADWSWVQARQDGDGRPRGTGVWRFAGAETARVISGGGPACGSFDEIRGEYGPFEGRFGMQASRYDAAWRRVRGSRFVPPGAPAGSPVFVEWRREDGRWVIAAFGDEGIHETPPRPGRPAHPFSTDTTRVPEDAAFVSPDAHTLVLLLGQRYTKYGLPRLMSADQVERVGVLGRVSIYVERGMGPGLQELIYVPVAPGRFQAYETPFAEPCR